MSDAIVANGLGHRYGSRWIFRHLDFQLVRGELAAILGPNGCGKSTLLSVLSGSMFPIEGQVAMHCEGLAMVPQSLSPSLPFTGLDMVLLGCARRIGLFSVPMASDYEAALKAMNRVQAGHLADRAFSVMSGGERQLVLIARALVVNSPVMLLDEPTAALDWHHQAHVLGILRELADEGLAVAFTTHTPQHALDFADRVMLMAGPGKQVSGVPDAVLSEDALSRIYRLPVKRFDSSGSAFSTAIPVFRKPGAGQRQEAP